MAIEMMNGEKMLSLLKVGYKHLVKNESLINDLNVFPVPDGDTGTNMRITLEKGIENAKDVPSLGNMFNELATGSLFGARGNSGVLLSQFIKGTSLGLDKKEMATPKELLCAFEMGYKKAYSATIEPTEGTMLTVAREGVENTKKEMLETSTFIDLFSLLVRNMSISLLNTPNLLPVLKEHGVIDSGGKGLLTIFEGILSALNGEKEDASSLTSVIQEDKKNDFTAFNANSVLDYGYCTEFILQLLNSKIKEHPFVLKDFISFLKEHGNSIVAFQEKDRVKVHVHTKLPSIIISEAQKYGEFISFKMENMALQHNETLLAKQEKEKARKPFAIVSVAQGEGLIKLFKDLGSDYVLDGGATMNSSVNDFLDAMELVNADIVFLLPNNPNLILSAKQAASLTKTCKAYVIESKSLQEGYMALQTTLKTGDIETVKGSLENGIQQVDSYFIAPSSKNSTPSEPLSYHRGDYLGGKEHRILVASKEMNQAFLSLIQRIPDMDDKELLFIFYGHDVSSSDVDYLKEWLSETYSYLDVGFMEGDESIYSYLIGVNK